MHLVSSLLGYVGVVCLFVSGAFFVASVIGVYGVSHNPPSNGNDAPDVWGNTPCEKHRTLHVRNKPSQRYWWGSNN